MDHAQFRGGTPGKPVPQVDPEDIKAIWELGQEGKKDHPGRQVATGVALIEHACRPGANIPAVTYRGGMLGMVQCAAPALLEPWTKEDHLADVVFRAIAEIPMEWIGVGVEREGWPFDPDDFMRRVRGAQPL